MLDGAALRRVLEQERPHLVVPEVEAIATDVLLELEKEGYKVEWRVVHSPRPFLRLHASLDP